MALTHAQKRGLEAAILAYLTGEGDCFARTVAAFKEEAQNGDGDQGNLVVSGAVLEKAWAFVHRGLNDAAQAQALLDAIASDDAAEVQLYVCVGVDVQALGIEEKEASLLHCAVRHNRLEIVQLLATIGHDVDAVSPNGTTPLYVAAQQGQVDTVRYLVERGADKNKARNDGVTPLLIAASNGHVAVVRRLVEQGADKDKAANDGRTPLFIAAQQGHFAVVRYLVKRGADKDKADDHGVTPFITACRNGHVDVAEYLPQHGCDQDHAAKSGWTALHYAAQAGNLDVAQLLFRYGAKLDVRTRYNELPADVATASGHPAVAAAIRAEEISRRDRGFRRDRGTEE